MKLLLALAVLSSTVFANEEVLLKCTRTSFSDLDQIIISKGKNAAEIVVTEMNGRGESTSFKRKEKDFIAKNIQLSDWYGYQRTLTGDRYGWSIQYNDECSSGHTYVICE